MRPRASRKSARWAQEACQISERHAARIVKLAVGTLRYESRKVPVNRLGKMLADLEGMKARGTGTQQVAIERMRPQLVATANALTNAIDLLNDRPYNAYFAEYREAVQTVSEQGDSLHQTLDAVLDYEAAKFRLNSLELLPWESGT